MFLKIFTAGPLETHAYLVGCPVTREAALIDAPPGVTALVEEEIQRDPWKVASLLITHSHWDHIGDAASLKARLKCSVKVHAADQENLIMPGSDGLPLLLPMEGVHPEGLLREGDLLSIGTLRLQVLETPGHTPGGVCFWFPQEKVLFSGDTLFKGGIGHLGFSTARPTRMASSLKKIARLPPETRVYPGHGPSTTVGAEGWIGRFQGGEESLY